MKAYVPFPNFDVCARLFKPEHLVKAQSVSLTLFERIKASTMVEEEWDGYIGNIYVGGTNSRLLERLDEMMFLWKDWRWALLCYAHCMTNECKRRGLEVKPVPTEWGHAMSFAQFQAWQAKLRDSWPFSKPVLPNWIFEGRVGRRHQLALAAIDDYYGVMWP
jgi:hypothetical protein